MFEYTIRRLLLMIPTGIGITFMVFCILQLAPDGPFERAVKQIKQANIGAGEVSMSSSDISGDSSELTPELLEKLRMQYGLDKPIVVRYLIWLGVYPKESKSKVIAINKTFRESVDALKFDTYKEYLLQKYVKVVKGKNNELIVVETGVGLEFDIPKIKNPDIKENFNSEKYYTFINNYTELPSNENIIKTWYYSDWEIKKVDEDKNIVTLVKKQFKGIFQGYLGYSEKKGKDVSTLIGERLHISAFFGLTGLILGYLVCIPLGIWKAINNGSRFDIISSIIVFVGYSIPGYILGIVLLVYFGGDYFPLHGWRSPNFSELSFFGQVKDQLHHAFLPMVCYMIGSFATLTVLMKNSLLENLSQDYVRTAFAKGLSEKRVIFKHAVRNSLIPLATGIGGIIGVFLAGSYLIEKTFGIDGFGLLGFNALVDRDYDIMMGTLVIGVVIRLLGNLISDLTYALVDPRIRFK